MRAFCARDIEQRSSRTLESDSHFTLKAVSQRAECLELFVGQNFRKGSVLTLSRYVSLSANMLG